VPWAHGFKSIKWLQRIVLTNDFRANDTYADDGNDPESYLKTAAYIDEDKLSFGAGETAVVRGTAISGWSGLKRVECWLRPDTGLHGTLADDDPAWQQATWRPCEIDPAPKNWEHALPSGVRPAGRFFLRRRRGSLSAASSAASRAARSAASRPAASLAACSAAARAWRSASMSVAASRAARSAA